MSDINILNRLLFPNSLPPATVPPSGYALDRDQAMAQVRRGYPQLFGDSTLPGPPVNAVAPTALPRIPITLPPISTPPQGSDPRNPLSPVLDRVGNYSATPTLGPLPILTGYNTDGTPLPNELKVSPTSPVGAVQQAIRNVSDKKIPDALMQTISASAAAAGAGARLKSLDSIGVTHIDPAAYSWQPITAPPQPDIDYPDVPTRGAPRISPIAAALAAAAGVMVPKAAGTLSAAPMTSAINLANQRYADQNQEYEKNLQQSDRDYADELRIHNEQLGLAQLNQSQPFARMMDMRKAQEVLAGLVGQPTADSAAGAALLDQKSGLPSLIAPEAAYNTAQGNEAAAALLPQNIIQSAASGLRGFQAATQRELADAHAAYYENRADLGQQNLQTKRQIYNLDPAIPVAPVPAAPTDIPTPSGLGNVAPGSQSTGPGKPIQTPALPRKVLMRQSAGASQPQPVAALFIPTHTIGGRPVAAVRTTDGRTVYRDVNGGIVKTARNPAITLGPAAQ